MRNSSETTMLGSSSQIRIRATASVLSLPGRLRRRDREPDRERGAPAVASAVRHPERATELLDDPPADGKAEPGAAGAPGRSALPEPIEDQLSIGGRHTGPVVRDVDARNPIVGAQPDSHLP